MYSIYLCEDGTYECHGRLQDSTVRWKENTLKEAIASLISFAKTMNNSKITKKSIAFYKAVQVTETKWIECKESECRTS